MVNNKLRVFFNLKKLSLTLILLFLLSPGGGTWAYLLSIRWFYVFLLAFLGAYLFTPLAIRFAHWWGIIDHPDEARKIHSQPIPCLGGLAVFVGFLLAIIRNLQFSPQLLGLVGGATLIFILGVIDDRRGISPSLRFLIQVGAALLVVASGVRITFLPHFPGELLGETLITLVWIVGMTNAINFLDGVDGLVGGLGIISSLFFFGVAWSLGQKYLSYLAIALAGASSGFLPFNWRPARVFLGDAGATFIGFLLAGIAVMGSWAVSDPLVALSTPLLVLGIPIFDMLYTTVARFHSGAVRTVKEWFAYTGRDHFHHRLMALGFTVEQTDFFIFSLSICLGLGALVIRKSGELEALFLLGQSFLIFGIVVVLMSVGRRNKK